MANESKEGPKVRGHTLADHQFGEAMGHEHGPDADHDHDNLESLGPLEENPIWVQDNVVLTSVGMDIGSSGTQVIFSRVHMRRLGEDLTSRYVVVKRETLYESPVSLTPYRGDARIDEVALGTIIDQAYGAARLAPADIDTGVVILTGEALRRENAERIAEVLAQQGGEFVCATAGHHMEAMLAAYGSGAVRTSHDRQERILNIDIGGGTTKLAIIDKGVVQTTAAVHVGGRLQVTDANGVITRLDPAGRHHAAVAGFDWKLGDRVAQSDLETVATGMAATLSAALRSPPLDQSVRRLYLTDPIEDFGRIDGIIVSGGVGEYVYGREERDFGDMGRCLGLAFRNTLAGLAWPLLPASACIRATALGASEYTVQLSGNTGHISSPGRLLPRRNVQVVHPVALLGERIDPAAVASAIRAHFDAFDLENMDSDVALALRWDGHPEYSRLRAFAEGVRNGLATRIARGLPIYLMLDGDVAMTLGGILGNELGIANDMLVIDGVQLRDFDYIDLGKIRLPSGTVPVTIKSLLFQDEVGGARARQRVHHHDHDHDHHHGHRHHHGGDRKP